MKADQIWVSVRALLMMIGSGLSVLGWVKQDTFAVFMTLTDEFAKALIPVIPAAIALGAFAWGLYVRWNTKAVPLTTALRADVPVVSSVTGATIPGRDFVKKSA